MLHTCSSVESLLSLARQGVGITLLPRPLVAKALACEQLMELDVARQPPNLGFTSGWRVDDDRILPRLLADSSREIIGGVAL